MSRPEIVVGGGGIAGLASADACAEVGARVTLLEAKSIRAATPAQLEIVPKLLRELVTLCVADACVHQGFPYSGVSLIAENGTPCVELPTERQAADRLPPAVGIAFDDFITILLSRAAALSAEIDTGRRVEDIAARGRDSVVGRQPATSSLVVVAAGADAPIVRVPFGPAYLAAVCQSWWPALIQRPHGLERPVWMARPPRATPGDGAREHVSSLHRGGSRSTR